MLEEIPSHLSRRYSWSFCTSAKLPQGTVFLKRKKQFTKGATITYSGSLRSKLLELASVALTLIVKTLYADSPGLLSMPQLWQAIHKHWSSPRNVAEADVEWNASRRATLYWLSISFPNRHPGQPRGKTKSSLKRIWIQDLPSIVELSFSMGVFTAAGKCRLQVEGTCIGNQISPILSGLPVLLAERAFLSSLPAAIPSSLLFLRYVDNRLILGPRAALQSQQSSTFVIPTFTKGLFLKECQIINGLFTIDAAARTATFNMPEQPWQLRSPARAGSWKLATSGYFPCIFDSPVLLASRDHTESNSKTQATLCTGRIPCDCVAVKLQTTDSVAFACQCLVDLL